MPCQCGGLLYGPVRGVPAASPRGRRPSRKNARTACQAAQDRNRSRLCAGHHRNVDAFRRRQHTRELLTDPQRFSWPSVLSLQEFTNLIGRAGRPGVSTEGSALVVLPERTVTRIRYGRRRQTRSRQWDGYNKLVADIEETTAVAGEGAPEDEASSPLALLLRRLKVAWDELTGGGRPEEFTRWLEQTAVVGVHEEDASAYRCLDSLDAFLIAALQEVEELRHAELAPEQVEAELTAIWRRTYAFALPKKKPT